VKEALMKEFRCADVVPDCHKTMRGATEQDILAQVANHALQDHGMQQVPQQLVEQVRSRIVEVPTA
jgi:predicted small metal-binding protein